MPGVTNGNRATAPVAPYISSGHVRVEPSDPRPLPSRSGRGGGRALPRRAARGDPRCRLLLPHRNGRDARAGGATARRRTHLLRPAGRGEAVDRERHEPALPRIHARGRRAHAGRGRLARADRHRPRARGRHRPRRTRLRTPHRPEPLARRPARPARCRRRVAGPSDGCRAQAAARVGSRPRRAGVVLRRPLRRALDAAEDRAVSGQGRPDAAARRRCPQGLRRADSAVGRAGKGRPAGRARRPVGRRSPGARRVRRQHRRDARVRHGGLPHRDEPSRDLATPSRRAHLGAVLLQPGARRDAAAHRSARRAGRTGPRGHTGSHEPDPLPLRRERAEVAAARPPPRARARPRPPARGARVPPPPPRQPARPRRDCQPGWQSRRTVAVSRDQVGR